MAVFAIIFVASLLLRNINTAELPSPRLILLGSTGIILKEPKCLASINYWEQLLPLCKTEHILSSYLYLCFDSRLTDGLTTSLSNLLPYQVLGFSSQSGNKSEFHIPLFHPSLHWKELAFSYQALASPVWEMCCLVGHTTLRMRRTLMAANALLPGKELRVWPKRPVLRREG